MATPHDPADPGLYAADGRGGDGYGEERREAYVRVVRVGDTEVGFVRLVPRGGPLPDNTFDVMDAFLDVDGAGNVIGINWTRRVD